MTREQIVGVLQFNAPGLERRDRGRPRRCASRTTGVIYSPIFGEVHGKAAIEKSYRDLFLAFADWTYEPRISSSTACARRRCSM